MAVLVVCYEKKILIGKNSCLVRNSETNETNVSVKNNKELSGKPSLEQL